MHMLSGVMQEEVGVEWHDRMMDVNKEEQPEKCTFLRERLKN